MTALAASLTRIAPETILWHAPAGAAPASVPVYAGQLQAVLANVELAHWRGKRVAIGKLPVLELLATLVLLDGVAAAILMLPAEEDLAASAARLEQAGIDCVLEGEGLALARALADASAHASAQADLPRAEAQEIGRAHV